MYTMSMLVHVRAVSGKCRAGTFAYNCADELTELVDRRNHRKKKKRHAR